MALPMALTAKPRPMAAMVAMVAMEMAMVEMAATDQRSNWQRECSKELETRMRRNIVGVGD
jgi:hypothetical protein